MSRPVLDLTVRHFTRELGDITLIGAWYGANIEDSEPVLCLIPTYRVLYDGVALRAKPCCVALSSAHLYDEPRYLLARSMEFSKAMGFEDSMTRTNKIAEAIHGSLLDLIKMPPRPVLGSFVGADATITDGMGRQRTVEMITDV
ncbi:hypothetical protein D3C78_688150 [compost metagenome]